MIYEELHAKAKELSDLLKHYDKENEYKTKLFIITSRDGARILGEEKYKEITDFANYENLDKSQLLISFNELRLNNKILIEENKRLHDKNIKLDMAAYPNGWLNKDIKLIEKEGLEKYLFRLCLYKLISVIETNESDGVIDLMDKALELYKSMILSEQYGSKK